MIKKISHAVAREIAFALNRSHCTGDPIHEATRHLLNDASDLGDLVDDFEQIVAPIIEKSMREVMD